MRLKEFDYNLPSSLIAQYPSPERGDSRLLVLHREKGKIEHRHFIHILEYLTPGDLMVMNNTRVIPARLMGKKGSGGKVEIHLIPPHNGADGEWEVMTKNLGKVKDREKIQIQFGNELHGELLRTKGGRGKITFFNKEPILNLLKKYGHVPLPPYIKRKDEPIDRDRYQTVYAEKEGSIAAPTAGLHFTPSLFHALKEKGIRYTFLTLHIGLGTFSPVKVENIEEHSMEPEWVEISQETAQLINETKEMGGRVIAVGTTTTRSLESFCDDKGRIQSKKGWTSLFIYPPFKFRVIDGLITNFHLPKSTLILLVSAFAGRDLILKAYQEAIERRYRFYSYGDAMLIL